LSSQGAITVRLDLRPDQSVEQLAMALARNRGARSLSSHLKQRVGLEGVKAALLREQYSAEQLAARVTDDPRSLAMELKSWPVRLTAARPIDEAISTAGGVRFSALDERGMLRSLPGLFCSGEMLDWEAPTGGDLISACMASGRAAAFGALAWVRSGA
jgi:predicted flavoprotein YhiN